MTKQVIYVSSTRPNCCGAVDAQVQLCLISDALVAAHPCTISGDETFPFTTIPAVLSQCYTLQDCCQVNQWTLVFTYDETLLADPATPLAATDVAGYFCHNCMTTWIEELVGDEVTITVDGDGNTILTTQHGCTYTIPTGASQPLLVQDSTCIDLSISGSPQQTLTADVIISAQSGNVVQCLSDGLYAPDQSGGGGLPLLVTDTATVDLTIAGSPQQTLSADVKVSADAGNTTVAHADGIYTPSTGQPLLVTDTSTIDFSIAGSPQQTITGSVKVSADVGNIISAHSDGLYATNSGSTTNSANSTERTTDQIANPFMGLQTNTTPLIAFNAAGSNPNNYPSRCLEYKAQWVDLEPTEGAYNFSTILTLLDKALASGQSLNLRVYECDPGDNIGPPAYLYNYAGWQCTQDDGGATVFRMPYWGNESVKSAHGNFLNALFTACGNHPALGTIDAGWGIYNENNYSGTHYNGTFNGTVPSIPGVGSELPPLTYKEIAPFFDRYKNAFPDSMIVTFPDQTESFNYGYGIGLGARADGWGYRNNPGQCPGGGTQMCTLYPNTFAPAGTAPNIWKTKRVDLETWNNLYTGGGSWNTLGYDYQASFDWAWQEAHAAELNIKNQFNPPGAMKASMEGMLLHIGYRQVLRRISHLGSIVAGDFLSINTSWENVGCAPSYTNEVVAIRLKDDSSNQVYNVPTEELANWLPGSTKTAETTIQIPTWLNASTFSVLVGLIEPLSLVPTIELAINGDDGRFWYDLGTNLVVTNAAPTTPPSTDFAALFASASAQKLTSSNTSFRVNGTDWSLALKTKLSSLATTQVLVGKGNSTAATQEYRVWFDQPSQRFKASFSNGATVYTATANTFGAPSINVLYSLMLTFDNTTKVLSLYVNAAAADTVSGSGNIAAGNNVFTVGADTSGSYLDGVITDLALWLVKISSTQRTQYYNSGLPLHYSEVTNVLKVGMLEYFNMAEPVGTRVGSRRKLTLGNTNAVTRVVLL